MEKPNTTGGVRSRPVDEDSRPSMRTEQAAELLGICSGTLINWRYLGKGPRYHKIGRSVRYSVRDICNYAQNCGITPGGDNE